MTSHETLRPSPICHFYLPWPLTQRQVVVVEIHTKSIHVVMWHVLDIGIPLSYTFGVGWQTALKYVTAMRKSGIKT